MTTKPQNLPWSRGDRSILYEECMSFLHTKHNDLSQELKETLSLCFMQYISEKYTRDDYHSKIDAELKRIKSAALTECSKNNGIVIDQPKAEVKAVTEAKTPEDKPTKENLRGHWKDEESEFWLFETGDFKMNRNDGSTSKGSWKIDGMLLTLYHDKMFGTRQKDFKILLYSENKFVYQSVKNKKETFTVERIIK